MSANAKESNGDPLPKPTLRQKVIGLSDWWKLQKESNASTAIILDLRSTEENDKRCLVAPAHPEASPVNLVVVHIPMSVVEKRSFELPARHVKFDILVSEADLERADSFLCGSHRKRPNPWKVVHVLLDTEEFWSHAKDMMMVDGNGSLVVNEQQTKRQKMELADTANTSTKSRKRKFPFPRLWQPDPMVETVLFSHLVKQNRNNKHDSSTNKPKQVWDLAAGAGRDVAFLAEELLAADNPYQIVAIDHRYNEKETKIVNDFWGRRGIQEQTTCLKVNLSQWNNLESAMASFLTTNHVAAMFCVRFWKPELVKEIAQSKSIHSGVLFGISHFCKPSLGASWNFDHPSEKTVLERNQLSELFESQWDILHDEIALDSDHGRTMIHFVARRR